MANSKIKQILVGTTTYDIEDADAAHLSTDNTFRGTNTFKKQGISNYVEIKYDGVTLSPGTRIGGKGGVKLCTSPSDPYKLCILSQNTSHTGRIKFPAIGDSLTGVETVALLRDIPTIEANPAASGTTALTKLKVGSTVYTLPGEKPTIILQTSTGSRDTNYYGRIYYTFTVDSGIINDVSSGKYNVIIYDQTSGGGYYYCPLQGENMTFLGEELPGGVSKPSSIVGWSFKGKESATTLSFWRDSFSLGSGGGSSDEQLQSQLCEYSVGLEMGGEYFDFSFLSSITDITGSPADLIEIATAMYYEGFYANYVPGEYRYAVNNFVRIGPFISEQMQTDCRIVGVTLLLGEGFGPGGSSTNFDLAPVFADPANYISDGTDNYYKVSNDYSYNIPNNSVTLLSFKKRILNCESTKPPILG